MSYQSIYAVLKATGINDIGACALMGNWEAESNCESIRVQGDINSSRNISKAYVKQVDNGKMSKTEFAKDSKGFGLAQWTYYSRKEAMYDFAKWQGVSIGDEQMQVDFAIKELSNEYANLLAYLKTTTNLYEATERVCKEYERPAVNNVDDRYKYALNIKDKLGLLFATEDIDFVAVTPNLVKGEYPLLTRRLESVELYCVRVAQFLLNSQGSSLTINGLYDVETENAVKKFQEKHELASDGQCGALTWYMLINGGNG